MLVLVEMRCDPAKLRKTFQMLGFDDCILMKNQEFMGGIVVAWCKDNITMEFCKKKAQYINLEVNYPNGKNGCS